MLAAFASFPAVHLILLLVSALLLLLPIAFPPPPLVSISLLRVVFA